MMPQIPIYIINLDDSHERMGRIHEKLDALGLNFQRFSAIRGTSLSESQINRVCPNRYFWWEDRYVTSSEIGCYLSHYNLIKKIYHDGCERVCILEDDAHIPDELGDWLNPNLNIPHNADILKLELKDHSDRCVGLPVSDILGRHLVFMPRRGVHGTAAYILTAKGAQKIVSELKIIKAAYDHSIYEFWNSQICTYHVYPPLLSTKGESIIGQEREFEKNEKTLFFRIRRRFRDINIFLKSQYFIFRKFGILYPFSFKKLSSLETLSN